MDPIVPDELADQAYAAAKAAFSEVREANPDQAFYAFGFWTDDSLQFLHPMANSEEALTETVATYQTQVDPKYGITSSHDSLRWSYGDWGFGTCDEGGHFDAINDQLSENFDRMVNEGDDEDDDEDNAAFVEEMDALFNALATGLHRLDREGFFGEGASREKITLLFVGDLAPELMEASVAALNPPPVLERYRKQIGARNRILLREQAHPIGAVGQVGQGSEEDR